MVLFGSLAFALFLPIVTAVTENNDRKYGRGICGTPVSHTYNSSVNAAISDFGAAESPAVQAPLLQNSKLWRGMGLAKRQNTCPTACRTTDNLCCEGCTTSDGSVPCGTTCCVDGYRCGSNNQCEVVSTCPTSCKTADGSCCAGCSTGDGSVACGDTCCVNGYFCDANTQCAALTVTKSVLATSYQTSTYVSTVYVSTVDVLTITRTESDIETVTVSSAEIATEIVTVTTSNADLRRRAFAVPTTPSNSHTILEEAPQSALHAVVTTTPSSGTYQTERPLETSCAEGDESPELGAADLIVLRKRQTTQYTVTVTTGTTTFTDVVTSVKTSTVGASSTFYTTQTTSDTKTTVLQAATTTRSTTTINIAHSAPGESETGPPGPPGPPGPAPGKGGLSTGAKAGIGAGAGGATLFILFLAGCFWRRRKKNSAGSLANNQSEHVAPYPAPMETRYHEDKMLRDSMTTPSSTAYSAVPASTLPEVAPGMGHGPYAYQSLGHEPSYAYGENPPQELWNAMPPQEMSGSPHMGYAAPHYTGASSR